MAQYTLVDPATGKQWNLPAAELTESLQMNCILFRDGEHLGIITHRDLVAFTRWCASETMAQAKEPPNHRVTHALSLVIRWLEDEKSVSSDELQVAAHAAWAADAAAWAAHAVWAAAHAAEAAAHAAEAAAHAAEAAAWAAAGAAAHDAGYISYEAQAQWLAEHLQSGK